MANWRKTKKTGKVRITTGQGGVTVSTSNSSGKKGTSATVNRRRNPNGKIIERTTKTINGQRKISTRTINPSAKPRKNKSGATKVPHRNTQAGKARSRKKSKSSMSFTEIIVTMGILVILMALFA